MFIAVGEGEKKKQTAALLVIIQESATNMCGSLPSRFLKQTIEMDFSSEAAITKQPIMKCHVPKDPSPSALVRRGQPTSHERLRHRCEFPGSPQLLQRYPQSPPCPKYHPNVCRPTRHPRRAANHPTQAS
mmetsp:Transcript_149349/g.286155  ORF Transcript_149349/g.286155 Transcript_149349/m.286155 type:complete len:130 (-) Transcript_149349:109-498(-)